jgi:hypothetical protein
VKQRRPSTIELERFRPSPFYLELDSASGSMRRRFRFRQVRASGFYDQVGEVCVALYRFAGDLYLRVDDRVWELDGRVTSAWSEIAHDRGRFSLSIGGEVVFACEYQVPQSKLDAADLNFEPGRNDVLRAVHAWVADPARWDRFYRTPK